MTSPTTSSPLSRRIGLAVGAGALVLLGGAGIAFAASSAGDVVETGWATVVSGSDTEPGATGSSGYQSSGSRDGRDCPDGGSGTGGSGGSDSGSASGGSASGGWGSTTPEQAPESSSPSQGGDL